MRGTVPSPCGKGRTMKNTREGWLIKATAALCKEFKLNDKARTTHVSIGFPKGARGTAIGQCWHGKVSEDGQSHIFVSPVLKDPAEVLPVLLHELVHADVGVEHGHRKPFITKAREVGLVKPWTATSPNEACVASLALIAEKLGPFEHPRLGPSRTAKGEPTPKKPGSRLRLWECKCSKPVKVRVASDEFKATCDVCGEPFELKS
jgi:hypothetical protein